MLGTTLWDNVGLVLSGINIGTNLGNALWHSGTLAGAKQAALLVSMTPLTLDLTERQALERVRKLESWKKLKFA
jgi:broad specificity polyphosphatase/5'/3'-nucleotidase SurE